MINDHYFPGCYQVRKQWVVDRINLVISMFNGQKGGTKDTIDYAMKNHVLINDVFI